MSRKRFFNYLNKIVKDFTIKGNKNKITKNLSEIGIAYKMKEDYELKKICNNWFWKNLWYM